MRDRHPQTAATGAPPEERGQQGELARIAIERIRPVIESAKAEELRWLERRLTRQRVSHRA
jgi:hypothetical protein